jgi:4,5-DOPA dioxygenase extradiol
MVEPVRAAHGGRAPVLFVGLDAAALARDPGPAGAALARFGDSTPRPAAVLVVSAQWQAGREIGITSALVNRGLPGAGEAGDPGDAAWSPPGAPDVAARAAAALEAAGFRARLDPARGLDAGAWVPLRILYPSGDVAVVQAALPALSPAQLVAFGAALAPLRDEGVLLLGSGGLEPGEPGAAELPARVAAWIDAGDVDGVRRWREQAPGGRQLDPLLVALGARAPGDLVRWVHRGVEPGSADLGGVAWLAA